MKNQTQGGVQNTDMEIGLQRKPLYKLKVAKTPKALNSPILTKNKLSKKMVPAGKNWNKKEHSELYPIESDCEDSFSILSTENLSKVTEVVGQKQKGETKAQLLRDEAITKRKEQMEAR